MLNHKLSNLIKEIKTINKYKLQYETYFLNPTYAHIIKTPEVSKRIKQEYNMRMRKLYEKGFAPPKKTTWCQLNKMYCV